MRAAAEELGYRPNLMARALSTQKSHVLGFISEQVTIDRLASGLIRGALREARRHGHVLFIDDASPDGTGAIADRLAATEPRIRVLHRTVKSGIGPAYRDGFRTALSEGADLIMEMDCDFSHDPRDVRKPSR